MNLGSALVHPSPLAESPSFEAEESVEQEEWKSSPSVSESRSGLHGRCPYKSSPGVTENISLILSYPTIKIW